MDKHTSIWGVVEKTLQAHDYIPDEYSIYNDDGEVDKDTKSSEYAGYNVKDFTFNHSLNELISFMIYISYFYSTRLPQLVFLRR